MRGGFSLLEVLAGTVVLGLLAAAVVPLTRRWAGEHGRLDERMAAVALVQRIPDDELPRVGAAQPLPGHDGWWLRSEALTPLIPPATPGQDPVPPSYGWIRLVVADGPQAEAAILAERLVLSGGQR